MEKTKRIHRIGTLTCGLMLILFGILFLLHIFLPGLDYRVILSFWPLLLLSLGIEMLTGLKSVQTHSVVYDKGAILLTILLFLFAAGMAGADLCLQYAADYML